MAGTPLQELTVDSFTPHVGSSFTAQLPEGDTLALELARAQTVGPQPSGPGRAQFALHFRGPGPRILQQAIYRLQHPAFETLEIFLVPVGRDGANVLYEAIFT